ncbi:glycerol-3-phosphate dehydrogenase, partial [Candidatus Hakubella thermalkaliphila]
LNFPFERRGDYVVAIGPEELPILDELWERGKKNGVLGMKMISADEMRRREPNINSQVSGALWVSTGGICDPFAVVAAAAENAVMNSVELMLETEALDFVKEGRRLVGVVTNRGTFPCRWVINCAGLYSDVIMRQAGLETDFKITPRKGEYYVFDRSKVSIHIVLFPVPSPISIGIMVTTTVHGNTIAGPTAHNVKDKEDTSVTPEGIEEVFAGAKKLLPSLDKGDVIAVFAGLRSSGPTGDFVMEVPREVEGFVNLAGIESPGLTSAPAIAQWVVDALWEHGPKLEEKPDWDPIRPPRPRFRDLSPEEQTLLIYSNSAYGRIVCRCETVTEGEIVAEVHTPVPARTYDGIKRRTRLGMGRCQGGFDTPRVIEILARELRILPTKVTKKGPGSELLTRPAKVQGGCHA